MASYSMEKVILDTLMLHICNLLENTNNVDRASLTSIPSLFKAYSSKFKMAILMVLGGGRTVRPILIALLLLESRTMISCLFPSAAVFLVIKIKRVQDQCIIFGPFCISCLKANSLLILRGKQMALIQLGEGLATALHRRKKSGISSETLPSLGRQWNFANQTHYKITLIFLQCDL